MPAYPANAEAAALRRASESSDATIRAPLMAAKKPTLFIVDGSNNVYRSYFAIRNLTNSSGLATNAVYGFTQMLRKLLKDHEPECVAVAFDIGSAKSRHEA